MHGTQRLEWWGSATVREDGPSGGTRLAPEVPLLISQKGCEVLMMNEDADANVDFATKDDEIHRYREQTDG